jgi:tRNA 2-thiouridine synthesizing protein C
MNKTLTFLARQAPYGSSKPKACQDMVLSASVFEQDINYVFMDDGVYQLLKHQRPDGIPAKNVSAALTALELYGVTNVFVDIDSLQERGLAAEDLLLVVELCDSARICDLIHASDMVFAL